MCHRHMTKEEQCKRKLSRLSSKHLVYLSRHMKYSLSSEKVEKHILYLEDGLLVECVHVYERLLLFQRHSRIGHTSCHNNQYNTCLSTRLENVIIEYVLLLLFLRLRT